MNVQVAFTMSTETTRIVLSLLQPGQQELLLPNRQQLQVISSLADIPAGTASNVQKFQYAALVQQEGVLLIWHDQLDRILVQAAAVEEKLLALVRLLNSVQGPTDMLTFCPPGVSSTVFSLDVSNTQSNGNAIVCLVGSGNEVRKSG